MSRPAADVVVVGAGPAGSAVAARLAASGHRVLLLDRARFPRRKPCGECLNPGAVRALAELGSLDRVLRAAPTPIGGWSVRPRLGPAFEGDFPADVGLALPRSTLDALLLEHAAAAGAEVRLGERVTELIHDAGVVAGVRVGRRLLRARLVIGADGLRSVVVRRLALLRRGPRLRKLALAAHLDAERVQLPADRGVMHLTEHGCLGIVRVGNGMANAVLVVGGGEARRAAGDAGAYFDRELHRQAGVPPSHRIDDVLATGPFDWPTRRAVAPGALLVGDAAGYYDPFTGQGIHRALRGAELAAATAARALRGGDVSRAGLASYERARRHAFASGERLQRLIELALARPRLFAHVAERLKRRPALADALVGVTGDARPAASLLDPRLLLRWVF